MQRWIFEFEVSEGHQEVILSLLSSFPFDAYEECENRLVTSVEPDLWKEADQTKLDVLCRTHGVVWTARLEPDQNWNAIWEASFDRIVLDDFCTIRAPFHPADEATRHSIVISPGMAFGTGHHETTRLMMSALRLMPVEGARLVDFGSGSGILAILAAQMGAAEVVAIENDPQAFPVLVENVDINGAAVHCVLRDHMGDLAHGSHDIVLANITRNVLIEHASDLAACLSAGGMLALSGFLQKDAQPVHDVFVQMGLAELTSLSENDWVALLFCRDEGPGWPRAR